MVKRGRHKPWWRPSAAVAVLAALAGGLLLLPPAAGADGVTKPADHLEHLKRLQEPGGPGNLHAGEPTFQRLGKVRPPPRAPEPGTAGTAGTAGNAGTEAGPECGKALGDLQEGNRRLLLRLEAAEVASREVHKQLLATQLAKEDASKRCREGTAHLKLESRALESRLVGEEVLRGQAEALRDELDREKERARLLQVELDQTKEAAAEIGAKLRQAATEQARDRVPRYRILLLPPGTLEAVGRWFNALVGIEEVVLPGRGEAEPPEGPGDALRRFVEDQAFLVRTLYREVQNGGATARALAALAALEASIEAGLRRADMDELAAPGTVRALALGAAGAALPLGWFLLASLWGVLFKRKDHHRSAGHPVAVNGGAAPAPAPLKKERGAAEPPRVNGVNGANGRTHHAVPAGRGGAVAEREGYVADADGAREIRLPAGAAAEDPFRRLLEALQADRGAVERHLGQGQRDGGSLTEAGWFKLVARLVPGAGFAVTNHAIAMLKGSGGSPASLASYAGLLHTVRECRFAFWAAYTGDRREVAPALALLGAALAADPPALPRAFAAEDAGGSGLLNQQQVRRLLVAVAPAADGALLRHLLASLFLLDAKRTGQVSLPQLRHALARAVAAPEGPGESVAESHVGNGKAAGAAQQTQRANGLRHRPR